MADMTVDKLVLADIPRGTYRAEGVTYLAVDWISEYIEQCLKHSQADAAWRCLIPQWLEALADDFAEDYEIRESENFTFLLPESHAGASKIMDEAERSLAKGLRGLPGIASDEGDGKNVVLWMASRDDYYGYLANYSREGTQGGSTGMCLSSMGYTHVVVNQGPEYDQLYTLSHEIVHGLLAHLFLPVWVEEGLVQIAESHLHNQGGIDIPIQDHRDYWREHTLAEYWVGSAFSLADEGQHLAYNLSRFMVAELMKDDREKFTSFASSANANDAGQGAAIEHLGKTLAQCLPPFLQIEFTPPR